MAVAHSYPIIAQHLEINGTSAYIWQIANIFLIISQSKKVISISTAIKMYGVLNDEFVNTRLKTSCSPLFLL